MNKQRQELIQTLYSAIKSGNIIRGDRLLTERELMTKFNVKRSILREALISLETLGVIDIRERQGMFVKNMGIPLIADSLKFLSDYSPISIMEQTFEVRLMIETAAAALAAERRSERACALLETELDFFKNFIADNGGISKAKLAFKHNIILHNIIVESSSNQVLQEISRGISDLLSESFLVLGSETINFHPYLIWPNELYNEHRDIILSIIERRPDDAYHAMQKHLKNSIIRNRDSLSEISGVIIDTNKTLISTPEFEWSNEY